ncbi:hypothetical protein ACFQ77_22035 [Streptomyces virginiae]|uniref:hypothetical protein n=1 Tax=Streptomyces virginiae TaxID=1961 RepID=UPI0036B06421
MAGIEYEQALQLIAQAAEPYLDASRGDQQARELAENIVRLLRREHAITIADD